MEDGRFGKGRCGYVCMFVYGIGFGIGNPK